jgi:hypothetical protein
MLELATWLDAKGLSSRGGAKLCFDFIYRGAVRQGGHPRPVAHGRAYLSNAQTAVMREDPSQERASTC